MSDVFRLRSFSPSSAALRRGRSASVFCRRTSVLDVAAPRYNRESTHRDRAAIHRSNDTPSCGTRHVKLVEHGLVEALANAVGLRALGLGARMIDVLDRKIELILMPLRVTAVLAAAIGQHAHELHVVAFE